MSDESSTLADIGEFGLIARLRRRLAIERDDVVVGLGDDAALIRTEEDSLVAADMLIEGVHFDLALSSARDAGYKAVAVNASDIAAMGGVARFALVCIALPPHTTVAAADAIYDGVADAARELGIAIVGGDTTAAPQIVLSIAIFGDARGRVVLRSGARKGDLVCVTGAIGAAAAGLALMRIAAHDPDASALLDRYPDLARAHAHPVPRIEPGPKLAAAGVSAMIDVSDGLARDVGHLAEESSVGVRIDADAIPVAAGVAEAASLLGVEAAMLAASGGDDYELAFTVSPSKLPAAIAAAAPVPVTVVGRITGTQSLLVLDGEQMPLERIGWEHFH
jgi:thiamine-monophosphate kinase